MPQEVDALYSRGKYQLTWDRRADGGLRTPFIQIVWYDQAARRYRSKSTGTDAIDEAEAALDRLYLERERGQAVCSACGRPLEESHGHPVSQAIADSLIECEDRPSIGSIRPRLAHMLDFFDDTDRENIACQDVDSSVITAFRKWSAAQPVFEGTINPKQRERAPGTTEASVRSLAAAINAAHRRKDTLYPAAFTALPAMSVSRTPQYRASIDQLAAMFRYCLDPQPPKGEAWSDKMRDRQRLHRKALLRFLQVSVGTWARPDAAHDLSTDPKRDQWHPAANVVQLNPRGRRQTKKYRPSIPVARQLVPILKATEGFVVPVKSVRKAFEAMLDELGMPRDRETGLKLIRRSVSQLARKRIGEERWMQGEMMLGHRKASTSDLYALFDPANLGLALEATEWLISAICEKCPGAFSGPAPEMRLVANGPTKGKVQ